MRAYCLLAPLDLPALPGHMATPVVMRWQARMEATPVVREAIEAIHKVCGLPSPWVGAQLCVVWAHQANIDAPALSADPCGAALSKLIPGTRRHGATGARNPRLLLCQHPASQGFQFRFA